MPGKGKLAEKRSIVYPVRFTPTEFEALKKRTRENGLEYVSTLIRLLIRAYLSNKKFILEVK